MTSTYHSWRRPRTHSRTLMFRYQLAFEIEMAAVKEVQEPLRIFDEL